MGGATGPMKSGSRRQSASSSSGRFVGFIEIVEASRRVLADNIPFLDAPATIDLLGGDPDQKIDQKLRLVQAGVQVERL
jgi:hypothetical protein